jgi:hypothetical protein
MGHIFVSHSEKDLHAVNAIIMGLEDAGYQTWYFERDVVPTQTAEAVATIPRPTPNPSLARSSPPGLPWRENARW